MLVIYTIGLIYIANYGRKASYWHGTSLANAEKILREGFIPDGTGAVYVTSSFPRASEYAERHNLGSTATPAVVELRVLDAGRLILISEDPGNEYKTPADNLKPLNYTSLDIS